MNTISWAITALICIGIVLALFLSVRVMRSEGCCGKDGDPCSRRRCSVLKDAAVHECSGCPSSDYCEKKDERSPFRTVYADHLSVHAAEYGLGGHRGLLVALCGGLRETAVGAFAVGCGADPPVVHPPGLEHGVRIAVGGEPVEDFQRPRLVLRDPVAPEEHACEVVCRGRQGPGACGVQGGGLGMRSRQGPVHDRARGPVHPLRDAEFGTSEEQLPLTFPVPLLLEDICGPQHLFRVARQGVLLPVEGQRAVGVPPRPEPEPVEVPQRFQCGSESGIGAPAVEFQRLPVIDAAGGVGVYVRQPEVRRDAALPGGLPVQFDGPVEVGRGSEALDLHLRQSEVPLGKPQIGSFPEKCQCFGTCIMGRILDLYERGRPGTSGGRLLGGHMPILLALRVAAKPMMHATRQMPNARWMVSTNSP